MLRLVAEGARHAAAARVRFDDLRAGNGLEESDGCRRADLGLLVAMAVVEQPAACEPGAEAAAMRWARARACAPASSSRPLENAARPQQPPLSGRTSQPQRSSSSIAARPMPGSVEVVNESARTVSWPWGAGCEARSRCPDRCVRLRRTKTGSGRCGVMPRVRSRTVPGG
ncbi:hypothetical protein [Streptomyces luteireticuli]|uniref:hypothetical protein n=1 Tax=Streptomyces luteireticuli TaxID=173858 RepID=UPI0031E35CE7